MNWTRLWAKESPKDFLSEILSKNENRETILGVLDSLAPSKDQVERDASKVIQYSKTQDYSVFAKEVWAEFIDNLDQLLSSKLSDREVDFFRGKLSASLDILRISYMARSAKERFDQERKQEMINKNI